MRFERLEQMARREVRLCAFQLPEELRRAMKDCPVQFEAIHPEADLLGLFEGVTHADDRPERPEDWPRITLYLGALWESVSGDPREFRHEVRITFLHELGHYLGLDEAQVEALGLA